MRGLHLEDVSVKKDLKLSHARVETVIEIGLKGEPRWALLEGLTYQDLGSSDAGDRLRDLIKRHSPYFSSRAYLQLEEYYKNHGEVEKADDVFIDMKRHECGLLHGRAWLFSWLMYLLVGYGRHPEYALIPSGGLVALGTIIFWCGGKHIVPKKDETKRSLTTPGMPSIPFGIALICSLLLLI